MLLASCIAGPMLPTAPPSTRLPGDTRWTGAARRRRAQQRLAPGLGEGHQPDHRRGGHVQVWPLVSALTPLTIRQWCTRSKRKEQMINMKTNVACSWGLQGGPAATGRPKHCGGGGGAAARPGRRCRGAPQCQGLPAAGQPAWAGHQGRHCGVSRAAGPGSAGNSGASRPWRQHARG